MEVLYKYSGLLPVSYFNEPTIKLSVPEHLNDPFEYSTSSNISSSIKSFLENMGLYEDELDDAVNTIESSIRHIISEHGIISFTETPRNALMWAHYASHHHGMCIGYKTDLLKHIVPNQSNELYDITISKPCKINYDNLRFSDEHPFSDPLNTHQEAVIRHLLKKSDEWIYEKEHRCIIPYLQANRISFKKQHYNDEVKFIKNGDRRIMETKTANTLSSWIKYCEEEGFLREKNGMYTIVKSDPEKQEDLSATLGILTNFANINFLIDIKMKYIDSVYFGCKVEKDVVRKYFDAIGESVKIYHFSICNKRFELIPKKVNEEYFNI